MKKPTTETRRHGEESGGRGIADIADIARDRSIGGLEEPSRNLTTETRRHGEESGSWGIAGIAVIADIADIARHRAVGLRRVWGIVLATLREIFDESAYDRFLLRTEAVRSVESYRQFLREREVAVARRAKCC